MASARYDKDGHAIVISPAGSGKSTCLAVPNLLLYSDPAFVIDPKGELAAITAKARRRKRKVVIVNPWGQHTEKPWQLSQDSINVLDDIDASAPTFSEDCCFIASLLTTKSARDSANAAFFKQDAITKNAAYIGFIKWFEPPERQNLAVLYEYVNLAGKAERGLWERMSACPHEFVAAAAADLEATSEDAPQQFTAVKSTMKEASNWMSSAAMIEALSSSTFNLDELKTGAADVFCIIPAERQQTHGAFLRLLTGMALRTMMRPPRAKKQVLFLIEEAASLGRLDILSSGMALLRGYNAFLMPFFQNIGQIRSLYGDDAQTFLANAAVRIFLAVQDAETAKLVSEMAGVSTLELPARDHRGNPSKVYQRRELITPDEVMRLPENRSFAFVANKPIFQLKKVRYPQLFPRWRYMRNPCHSK